MESVPHIDFQGMEASAEVCEKITRHLARQEDHNGRLTARRVTVKAPSGNQHTVNPYEIKIHSNLPGEREAAVDHTPHQVERHQDFSFALNDASNRAGRQLQDQVGHAARRKRAAMKDTVSAAIVLLHALD